MQINLSCPNCGAITISQPSISPGIILIFCYTNKVTKKDEHSLTGRREIKCGYRGFYNEETKKLKSLAVTLKRPEKGSIR